MFKMMMMKIIGHKCKRGALSGVWRREGERKGCWGVCVKRINV
jgi:hypothetical protein